MCANVFRYKCTYCNNDMSGPIIINSASEKALYFSMIFIIIGTFVS